MSRDSTGKRATLEDHARINSMVLRVIRTIPRGRVATYGSIAEALDLNPRRVAHVLAHDPASAKVPWHRVVGAGGRLAITRAADRSKQARLLRAEKIKVLDDRVREFRAVFFAP